MSPNNAKWFSLVGRILLGLIFVMSGLGKLGNFAGTAGFMASKGMPAATLFLVGAIAIEILGGLSVLAGFKTRWGAAALIVFLVPATLIFHKFWGLSPMETQMQMANFLKNVSIGGGLLGLIAAGPGAASVDAKLEGSRASSPSASRVAA
jgi:putative oxidoreductase